MVVDKYGNSMRITKLNNDGTYQCATNMGMTDAGSFKEHDITLRNYQKKCFLYFSCTIQKNIASLPMRK